jgi:hypothetical protein
LEVFVGYSGTSTDRHGLVVLDSVSSPPARQLFHGAAFGLSLSATKHWRFVLGEISWQRHDSGWDPTGLAQTTGLRVANPSAYLNNYQILFGPEFTRRSTNYTFYLHTLAGVATHHLMTSSIIPREPFALLSDQGPAFAAGGGAEVRLGRRWSYRLAQFDYLPTHMNRESLLVANPVFAALPNWQHNWRFQTGIVVKLRVGAQRP